MATHSSILVWKIPQTEETDGLQSMGSQESDITQRPNNNNGVYNLKMNERFIYYLSERSNLQTIR